jgi:hypothetical protein
MGYAGQEKFRTLTCAYYRGADGIIMVYDVGSEDSFRHINDWFAEVNRYVSENTCKLLVGNKIDKGEKVISTERGQVSSLVCLYIVCLVCLVSNVSFPACAHVCVCVSVRVWGERPHLCTIVHPSGDQPVVHRLHMTYKTAYYTLK